SNQSSFLTVALPIDRGNYRPDFAALVGLRLFCLESADGCRDPSKVNMSRPYRSSYRHCRARRSRRVTPILLWLTPNWGIFRRPSMLSHKRGHRRPPITILASHTWRHGTSKERQVASKRP